MSEATNTDNTQTRAQINSEIRSIAKTASLDQAWIDSQIDADAILDQVRAAALDAMSKRSPVVAISRLAPITTIPPQPLGNGRRTGAPHRA